jgi:hypothetical protein
MEIAGPWTVNFDPRRGGPESVTFPELTDWSQHADEGIRYYSGAAVYHKVFTIDFTPEKDRSYFLQLEDVRDVGIAVVTLNGKEKETVWTKPFRVDISGDLKEGDNTLRIKVVNSWFNRVAGDERSSGDRRFTSTNIFLQGGAYTILEPSGLLGPVRIMKNEELKMKN